MKKFLIIAAIFILIVALLFVLRYINLGFNSFFLAKERNVERKAFEQSKSYVHGTIQNLAKYYKEWNEAKDQNDKQTIENVIIMQFAEFNADDITNEKLKRFLINIRGY